MAENENLVPFDAQSLQEKLTSDCNNLTTDIIDETDVDKTKDLLSLFNLYQAKRNTLRVAKLNEIMDNTIAEVSRRIETSPSTYGNDELNTLIKTVQGAIDFSTKGMNSVDNVTIVPVQQNQTINIGNEAIDRDSKEKVINAVQSILKKIQTGALNEEENGESDRPE